jgi:4-aminobutyrate aminotransferase
MTTNESWLQREKVVCAGVLPQYFDVVAESGEGSWITDVEGRRYLDFSSGIAVTSVGHCNPEIVAAIEGQARTLLHTSVVTRNKPRIELAEKLVAAVPYINSAQVFFCNSGAEAVDGAIKLARQVTKKPGIISFRRGFHGRTIAATSLTTARGKYRSGYEPLLSSVYTAPYCLNGDVEGALNELDQILTLVAPEGNIGAMIVEPVLGEGGYVVPPVEWLQGLRQRATDHGILLIFDEVQAGIGRTGRMFAAETFGVTPDVILFAKGIANGLPLGGIIASRDLMDKWPNGTHGTTFGGNPVSCAAALAVLSVIEDENLLQRTREAGAHMLAELQKVKARSIVDVRGVGFMIGIELVDDVVAETVQKKCLDDGLLILVCGAEGNVVRLIPSLTVTDDEIAEGIRILTSALQTS